MRSLAASAAIRHHVLVHFQDDVLVVVVEENSGAQEFGGHAAGSLDPLDEAHFVNDSLDGRVIRRLLVLAQRRLAQTFAVVSGITERRDDRRGETDFFEVHVELVPGALGDVLANGRVAPGRSFLAIIQNRRSLTNLLPQFLSAHRLLVYLHRRQGDTFVGTLRDVRGFPATTFVGDVHVVLTLGGHISLRHRIRLSFLRSLLSLKELGLVPVLPSRLFRQTFLSIASLRVLVAVLLLQIDLRVLVVVGHFSLDLVVAAVSIVTGDHLLVALVLLPVVVEEYQDGLLTVVVLVATGELYVHVVLEQSRGGHQEPEVRFAGQPGEDRLFHVEYLSKDK